MDPGKLSVGDGVLSSETDSVTFSVSAVSVAVSVALLEKLAVYDGRKECVSDH